MTSYTNYQEARQAAINSPAMVCVLQKDRRGDFLVADSATGQDKLVKGGYRPA